MKKKFQGFWATYEYLDDFCNTIKELKKNGFHDLSTHSPCPRHEIDHALQEKQSRVPFFTLLFAGTGTIIGYLFASWASVDWPLPVSGKPLISFPPYTIIGFELTILFGAYGTMLGVVFFSVRDALKKTFPKSLPYRQYPRFSNDRFGLVVRCSSSDFSKVEEIFKKYTAEEYHHEQ